MDKNGDFENSKLKLVLLVKDQTKMRPAIQFLNRRGWPSVYFTDIHKMIHFCENNSFDAVLVSYTLDIESILKLPHYIEEKFKMTCIPFEEFSDQMTKTRIKSSTTRHAISGSSSGPNIHRKLLSIISDEISLDEGHHFQYLLKMGENTEQDREFQQNADELNDENVLFDTEKFSGENNIIIKTLDSYEVKIAKTEKSKPQSFKNRHAITNESTTKPNSQSLPSLPWEKGTKKNIESLNSPTKKKKKFRKKKKAVTNPLNSDKIVISGKSDKKETYKKTIKDKSSPHLSAMTIAVEDVLKNSFPKKGEIKNKINIVRILAVIQFNSKDLKGYLVIAFPGGLKDIKGTVEILKESMEQQFKKKRLEIDESTLHFMPVKPVRFEKWAKNKASFYYFEQYLEHQIGIAFFNKQNDFSIPKKSFDENMSLIDVDDISTDQPVNFKAYLHLEKNNKFYSYLNEGSILSSEQKERMKSRNVSNFFIDNKDVEKYKFYTVKDEINSMIGDDEDDTDEADSEAA